jgi:hypothetical protein
MEILSEPTNEAIKRGRGRPKKEKLEAELDVPLKKRGRPRKEINLLEIREKMKPGPKTNLTSDKTYYTNYYNTHYKGVCITCPSCNNPNVNVNKIHRHMRTHRCWLDTKLNSYGGPVSLNSETEDI